MGGVVLVHRGKSSPQVWLRIEPRSDPFGNPIVVAVGQTFRINVSVIDVTDLYGFEFKLSYNTTLLESISVVVVPFLNEPTNIINKEIDEQNGVILLNASSVLPAEPKSGSGTLATITFNATSKGSLLLDIRDDKLLNSEGSTIDHITEAGYLLIVPMKLYVNPSAREPIRGESFHINVTLADAENLYGWEFELYYPTGVLTATEVVEGPFLKTGGSTYFQVKVLDDSYNATHGRIHAYCSLMGAPTGTYGSGVLATIILRADSEGSAILDLYDTKLANRLGQPIFHGVVDGKVTVQPSASVFPIETIVTVIIIIGLSIAVLYYVRRKRS